MKKIIFALLLSTFCMVGDADAQPRVKVSQDAPPPEPCAPGQSRDQVDHDASGVDETLEIEGLKAPCLELTVHLPKAMDPANKAPIIPTPTIYDRTSENELIEVAKGASAAANEVAKRMGIWNFGIASQVLVVSHKGESKSYGLLGLYGVRSTSKTLVQLQGGIGKDNDYDLAVGAALMAGFKVGGHAAIGLGLNAADSIDQRGNADREVLMLRSVGLGPSILMKLGAVNFAISGGVAWSGKPVDGRRVDGVVVEQPSRSYAFGAFGTVTLTVGLRGLAN